MLAHMYMFYFHFSDKHKNYFNCHMMNYEKFKGWDQKPSFFKNVSCADPNIYVGVRGGGAPYIGEGFKASLHDMLISQRF